MMLAMCLLCPDGYCVGESVVVRLISRLYFSVYLLKLSNTFFDHLFELLVLGPALILGDKLKLVKQYPRYSQGKSRQIIFQNSDAPLTSY